MSVKAYALTTRARVMDFMGVSSLTTVQENVLDRLIDAVTDFVESYCQRRFKQTAHTAEYHEGDGSEYITLEEFPVSSTETFTLSYRNTTANENSFTTIDSEDYFVDYDAGIVQLTANARFLKDSAFMYKVAYTAGYNYDNAATFLSDYAADLEYAAWKLISTAFNKRKGEAGVQSESIGDYSVTYTSTLFENSEIREIVDKYRKVEVRGMTSPLNY